MNTMLYVKILLAALLCISNGKTMAQGHFLELPKQNRYSGPKNLDDNQPVTLLLNDALYTPTVYISPMFFLPYCGPQNTAIVYTTVQVIMNNEGCAAPQSLACPLVNIVDSALNKYWPVPAGKTMSLPANRTYFIHADLSVITDTVLLQKFYVMVTWNACEGSGNGIISVKL